MAFTPRVWDLINTVTNLFNSDYNANMVDIQTELDSNEVAIATEVTNRGNADTVLQNNINTEASQRIAGDNALDTRIDNLILESGNSSPEVVDARGCFCLGICGID